MQTDTKSEGLQQALNKAAFGADGTGDGAIAVAGDAMAKQSSKPKGVCVSPKSGAVLGPGPGRPKGVKDRMLNVREAILTALDMAGGPAYLYKLSQGNSSDRAAFTNLVAKVLPTQIQQEVSGGIQIQLSWLGQRSIGTVTAQAAEQITQVVDLERDSKGKYRIAEPSEGEQGVSEQGAAASAGAQADPPSPLRSGGGGGG